MEPVTDTLDPCIATLELHFKVTNIRDQDTFSKSDPFGVISLKSPQASTTPANASPQMPSNPVPDPLPPAIPKPITGIIQAPRCEQRRPPEWERVGMTETVWNAHNAVFAKSFIVNYFFERSQKLAFDLFDRDSQSDDLARHDYLGSAECTLPAIVRSRGQSLTLPLIIKTHPHFSRGSVTITAEEITGLTQSCALDLTMRIRKPNPFCFYTGSGPYLYIKRRAANAAVNSAASDYLITYKSDEPGIFSPDDGRYAYRFRFKHNFERLSRSDESVPLRFEIAFMKRGNLRIVAQAEKSLNEWSAATNQTIELQHPTAKKNGKPKSLGTMTLNNKTINREYTFYDYVVGGCEISLVVGIDFTASNGDPQTPGTLHYIDMFNANEYELAIRSVGDILAEYDSDQLFPAFGFGARLPPSFETLSNCFSLTGNTDPICQNIDGVLDAYRQTLYNVRLSGPTVLAELVRQASLYARQEEMRHSQSYTILLVVTDGVINDFERTQEEIARASGLPLSIVIIGVGGADFSEMVKLDGDDMPRRGRMQRDIVQFVPFRTYRDCYEMLCAEVLKEIPGQLVEYMTMRNIVPRPPPT